MNKVLPVKSIFNEIKLEKSLRGELYDVTFSSKGNVFGELKAKQEGTTLTLEKAIQELLIIEETSTDDKTAKRLLRKEFLIRCANFPILNSLFQAFTQFLNGGENKTSHFIINVSGGNLIILFAHLILDIVNDKFTLENSETREKLIETAKKCSLMIEEKKAAKAIKEIKEIEEIVNSAQQIITNGFSDLDFYIIENSEYENPHSGGGETKRPTTNPSPVRRSLRARIAPDFFLNESSKNTLNKTAKKHKKEGTPKQLSNKTRKKSEEKMIKDEKKKMKERQGFIVYRIKTRIFLTNSSLITKPNTPEELKELKTALLDLVRLDNDPLNRDYNPKNHNVNQDDYRKLHEIGLPIGIGKGIDIYPQLFQEKYLTNAEELGLSSQCIRHLKYLKYEKKILEASRNLNIYLLMECLREYYMTFHDIYNPFVPADHYNLLLFLHELCYSINEKLEGINKKIDIFTSLTTLQKSYISIDEIINQVTEVLINHQITRHLKEKLESLFNLENKYVQFFTSKTPIESNPFITQVMLDAIQENLFNYIPEELKSFSDHELLNLDSSDLEEVDTDDVGDLYGDQLDLGNLRNYGQGKKIRKSKKKRKVYKKYKKMKTRKKK
jgi:hypothetical protein